MASPDQNLPEAPLSRVFARKVRFSTWALFFERLWPRLWLLVALATLLAVLSLSGAFVTLSSQTHGLVLGLFAIAALAAAVYAGRVSWPTREEAIRRIERRSGVPHRPATSYEDTLTAYSDNPVTQNLWQAHRERLARAMARLKVGRPSPRADRFDPLALRVLPLLLLIPAVGLVSGSIYDRLSSTFRFGAGAARTDSRVDAWITPPAYTGKPPVMLADGSSPTGGRASAEKPKLFEVPIKSILTLRGSGFGSGHVSLEVTEAGSDKPVTALADPPKEKTDISEVRYELQASSRVRALAGGEELGSWTFDVIPDQPPKIALDEDWRRTAKGSLRLAYKGEDDYGVARAIAKVKQANDNGTDPNKAWARPAPLKGPRLPLERPPEIVLKVPAGATKFDTSSLHDLGSHPWAGQTVELWLEATDVAGQVGRSEAIVLTLPARTFRKPLARAVVEQRRKLAEDSRNRPAVVRALDALTIEPEGFIDDVSIYLSMRSVYHRIERDNARAAVSSAVDQLWDIALKIEDGKLSDAEQALRDARDRLAKALEEGASEEEIKALMQELKEAMSNYMEEMQKNAEQDGEGDEENQRQISKEDMEQMMRDLEENAKNGSREEAERLLSEMQEMMENMRAGETAQSKEQQERDREMMKKLDGLSDLTGRQQKLMDDTFNEGRKHQEQQRGGSQKGQQQDGQQGQSGHQRQKSGKSGSDAMAGEPQRSDGKGSLMDRQSDLRKKLEQLQKELEEMSAGGSDRLKDAEEAMKSAEQSLEQGEMDEAAQSQAEALEGMREGAQKMAEQMQKNARQRAGRGEDTHRDPLDRPQRAEGPDLGNSVKVPNAIDAQRAREILDELRKRSGQSLRPPVELDYIDRLLKRF